MLCNASFMERMLDEDVCVHLSSYTGSPKQIKQPMAQRTAGYQRKALGEYLIMSDSCYLTMLF